MGSPLPPPAVGNVVSYYGNAGHAQGLAHDGNITSSPHNQPIRYPLPAATDGRMMSGGRHKKEIKRRTKTGCLTCRKRRIKVRRIAPLHLLLLPLSTRLAFLWCSQVAASLFWFCFWPRCMSLVSFLGRGLEWDRLSSRLQAKR